MSEATEALAAAPLKEKSWLIAGCNGRCVGAWVEGEAFHLESKRASGRSTAPRASTSSRGSRGSIADHLRPELADALAPPTALGAIVHAHLGRTRPGSSPTRCASPACSDRWAGSPRACTTRGWCRSGRPRSRVLGPAHLGQAGRPRLGDLRVDRRLLTGPPTTARTFTAPRSLWHDHTTTTVRKPGQTPSGILRRRD